MSRLADFLLLLTQILQPRQTTLQLVHQMGRINCNRRAIQISKTSVDFGSSTLFYSLLSTLAWGSISLLSWDLHCLSHSHPPADLHQWVADDNSKDRRAQVYDFSTFRLKPSSTSEFKLWWETSLGCEHLISPWVYATIHTYALTGMHTHTRAHTELISCWGRGWGSQGD